MAELDRATIPWLTSALLENILFLNKSSENNKHTRVIDFEIYDAVGKGENYTSHMIRVFVKYSDRNDNKPKLKSFVIKTTLAPEWHDKFEKSAFFKREMVFYRDLLPKFQKYQNMFDKNFKLSPTPYKVSEHPLYFIFEDLKSANYRNMERRIGLNFNETVMVLKKLAAFHAMTAMLNEEYPDLIDVHRSPFLSVDDNFVIDSFMCGMQDCEELCLIWPGFEHISKKLKHLLKTIKQTVMSTFESDADEFKAVTHGDLWTNNIMYSFDEQNRPKDVIIVDFQFGYFGSPAIDLTYLLYTSTTNDIKEQEWDQLVRIYHTELVRILKAIGYPKRLPTLTDIHIQIHKRSKFAVLGSLMILGPRHIEKIEHADLEWFQFDNEKSKKLRQELYKKDEMRLRTQYLLDYFDRKGFLDCL